MLGKKEPTTGFYMNMPITLKKRLELIAQHGKPRRNLTGLIVHIMTLYGGHILDPIEDLDGMLGEIAIRTEHFDMAEMLEGGDGQ